MYHRNPDETIQSLKREYRAYHDRQTGAKLFAALVRRDNLVSFIENKAIELSSPHSYGEIPKSAVVYMGLDPETNALITAVVVMYVYTELDSPPEPKMEQFMTPYEREQYQRRWSEYLGQSRGDLRLYACRTEYIWDEDTWDNKCYYVTETAPSSDAMAYFKETLMGSRDHGYIRTGFISIIDLLDVEIDFEEELEDIEEEPEIIHEPCEDYPACGHGICPPRWSTGGQAAMVCTCGKLLPVGNRFSICNSCLGIPSRDDYPNDDDFGDYDFDEY